MDQELLDLINRLRGEGEPLADDELARLHDDLAAIAADVDPETASDDDIAALSQAGEVMGEVRAEQTARAEAAEGRRAEAARLRAEIAGEPAAPEPAPAEPEPEPTPPAEAVPPAPEGVAAGGGLPSLQHLAGRAPRRSRPVAPPDDDRSRAMLIASADVPGVAAGAEVGVEQWAVGVSRKMQMLSKLTAGSAAGDGEKVYLGTIRRPWPAERYLDGDAEANEDKIRAVASPQAIAAAGGICGPVDVDFSVVGISSAERPVRDSLAQFGMPRGGLRYIKPHTMASVSALGPAARWSAANDAAPSSPATKPHATFVCQAPVEVDVDAITSIVQFGNFQARFFPEQVDEFLQEVDAVHARLAEATLLAAMVAGSVAINAGNNGVGQTGAASEFLAEVDRAAANYRYVNRMAPESPLHLAYPEWFEDMMRADLARELPGNSGGQSERLAVADGQIAQFFTARNINMSTFLDSPTGFTPVQGFVAQGPGDLLPWPTKVLAFMYHEGAWGFGDGGELNLGMIRDSTLNLTNDFQMFSETFEIAFFRGHASWAITMDLCAFGGRAGTVDTSALCTSGS